MKGSLLLPRGPVTLACLFLKWHNLLMTPAQLSHNGLFQSMFWFFGLTNGLARLPTFLKRPVHFSFKARAPNRSIIWLLGAIVSLEPQAYFYGKIWIREHNSGAIFPNLFCKILLWLIMIGLDSLLLVRMKEWLTGANRGTSRRFSSMPGGAESLSDLKN